MKVSRYILALVFGGLSVGSMFGQSVYYSSNVTTSATNVPPGAQAPVFTVPYAKITVCSYPVTAPTNSACTNTVPIFSDQGLAVPLAQPLIADGSGNFGFWISSSAGTYAYSVQSATGAYLGTYTITVGGSGGGSSPVGGFPAVNTFGDSLSQGAGSTLPGDTSSNGVTGTIIGNTGRGLGAIITSAFGPGSHNFAHGGDMSEDGTFKAYESANPTVSNNPASTMLFGTNDVNVCGSASNCQDTYTRAMMFMAVHLSTPNIAKVLPDSTNCTTTGTWATTTDIAHSMFSRTNGSTMTCTITLYGTVLYYGYEGINGQGGTSSILIDGAAPSSGSTIAYNSYITTPNGSAVSGEVQRYTGLTAGVHTFKITVTSATSTSNSVVPVFLAGPYPAATGTVAPPSAYLGGVPYQYTDANSSLTAAYDTLAHNVQTTLSGDSLNVQWVPTRTCTNSTTSFTGGYLTPNGTYYAPSPSTLISLHWGNLGHQQEAQCFLSAMNTAPVRNNTFGPTLGYAQDAAGYVRATKWPLLSLNSEQRLGYLSGMYTDGTNTFINSPTGGVFHWCNNGSFTCAALPLSSANSGGGTATVENTYASGNSEIDFLRNTDHAVLGILGFGNPTSPFDAGNMYFGSNGATNVDLVYNDQTNFSLNSAGAYIPVNLRTNITGITYQCLHVDTSGNLTGTGSDCGSGTGIANATFTVGTTAVAANTCGSAQTVTMTGVTTSSTFSITAQMDLSGVTGWGPASSGLYIQPWPTANTLNYKVCNATSASITPGASATFNVSAK